MSFKEILLAAKAGDTEAILELLDMYDPLLKANAIDNGNMDEDLYQELCIVLLNCIRYFEI